jgi:molybdopterin/thiamine biosynthesis adenylyltransferase
MKVAIVGAGGVGSYLAEPLCRYLQAAHPGAAVTIFDGDSYELKNADRQRFTEYGNKAVSQAEELQKRFPHLVVEGKPHYVTEDNAFVYLEEGSYIFCCVDNHASRKLLSDQVGQLRDAVLISGGNEYDDGNVQVYERSGAIDKTPPLTYLHPEIETPTDKNPADMDCVEMAQAGSPQLIFANLKVATEMLAAFWRSATRKPPLAEVYFDLKNGAQRAVKRETK